MRIDDIDAPREVPGAADSILRTLEAFDLNWDGPVLYQSSRLSLYADMAHVLLEQGLAFRCSCTRKELRMQTQVSELGPRYAGTCRTRSEHHEPTSIRALAEPGPTSFHDLLQGRIVVDVADLTGDFVIHRKDDLPAYHLATLVDDHEQGITDIVRGRDLLLATGVQLHLARMMGLSPTPSYAHIPVLVDSKGNKLSKQQGALAVDVRNPGASAALTLVMLGCDLPPELQGARPAAIWEWAIAHWHLESLAGQTSIRVRGA